VGAGVAAVALVCAKYPDAVSLVASAKFVAENAKTIQEVSTGVGAFSVLGSFGLGIANLSEASADSLRAAHIESTALQHQLDTDATNGWSIESGSN